MKIWQLKCEFYRYLFDDFLRHELFVLNIRVKIRRLDAVPITLLLVISIMAIHSLVSIHSLLFIVTLVHNDAIHGVVNAELSWNPLWDNTQPCLVNDVLLTRGILIFRYQSGQRSENQTCSLQVTGSMGSQFLLHTMNATMQHTWVQYNLIANELTECPGEYVSLQNQQTKVCFPYAISSHINLLITMKGNTGSIMIQERSIQSFNKPCPEQEFSIFETLDCYKVKGYDSNVECGVPDEDDVVACELDHLSRCNAVLGNKEFLSFCDNDLKPSHRVMIIYRLMHDLTHVVITYSNI